MQRPKSLIRVGEGMVVGGRSMASTFQSCSRLSDYTGSRFSQAALRSDDCLMSMLSPVGLPPQLPGPDPGVVALTDRAIPVPSPIAASARWEAGAVLTAAVRVQNDEVVFRVGDHFFTSRPIPGVSEYSRMSMLVARDLSGALSLVPLMPLAGSAIARVGGAPPAAGNVAAPGAALEDTAEVIGARAAALHGVLQPAPSAVSNGALRNLSQRLHVPSALASWASSAQATNAVDSATRGVAAASSSNGGLATLMQALATAVADSGLFFESKLRERRPVPAADVKRQLLEAIDKRGSQGGAVEAWAALDELVGLQSAAGLAKRSGGTLLSFVMPAPDGVGAWWVTLQQDAARDGLDYAGGDGRQERRTDPWRIRLVGVSLPFGDIDLRIEQLGVHGVGVTVLTDTAEEQGRWTRSREELSRRLEEAGLILSRWAVIDREPQPTGGDYVGRLQSVRV